MSRPPRAGRRTPRRNLAYTDEAASEQGLGVDHPAERIARVERRLELRAQR